MGSELKVDWQKFKAVVDAYAKSIQYTGEALAGELRYEAPVDTGRLSGSFGVVQTSRFSVQVGTNVIYSLPILGMTVRHVGSSGRPALGTMGNDYPDRAIENTRKKLTQIIHNASQEAGVN